MRKVAEICVATMIERLRNREVVSVCGRLTYLCIPPTRISVYKSASRSRSAYVNDSPLVASSDDESPLVLSLYIIQRLVEEVTLGLR